MDKKYIELFAALAQANADSAEQVMDYDREQGNEAGLKTATTMRDDFQDLACRLDDKYEMSKADALKLLLGAMVQVNQLQLRIDALKKAMTGYQTDVIPALQEITEKAETDEEAKKMANEKFIIKNN